MDELNQVARRMFLISWGYFAVAAALGLLLRLQFVFPTPGVDYGNFLHTHSHIAFLGWIYNAYFALAVRYFARVEDAARFWRIFLLTQIAVIGMAVTFPIQGYAAGSIIFSSLHMVFALIFVWMILRKNRANPSARKFLWAATGFLVLSSLGPLALGPIMVGGAGETAFYPLAIGFYLHFQYNGWFIFFLLALAWQGLSGEEEGSQRRRLRLAWGWLVGGCVMSYALVALPLNPPGWVFAVAAVGGLAQWIGFGAALSAFRPWAIDLRDGRSGVLRMLAVTALSLLAVKFSLQVAAAFPGLVDLATNRFIIIAFMHLIFLGIATPGIMFWAMREGWIGVGRSAKAGLFLLAGGAVLSQVALAYVPLAGTLAWPGWPRLFETQAVAAAGMLAGVIILALARRSGPRVRRG